MPISKLAKLRPIIARPMIARIVLASVLSMPLAFNASANGGSTTLSTASAWSVGVPLAYSASVAGAVLSDGVELVVDSAVAGANGVTWVLERTVDGASVAVEVSAAAAQAAVVSVGTVMSVVTISGGWLLMEGPDVVAMVPNALGARLLHDQRITY